MREKTINLAKDLEEVKGQDFGEQNLMGRKIKDTRQGDECPNCQGGGKDSLNTE